MPSSVLLVSAALLAATAALQPLDREIATQSARNDARLIQHDARPKARVLTTSETEAYRPASTQRWVF
ncbi:hypothetical protein [Stutzerimonas azotifigens]|uniref:hypothetical protein n=1 Tax=Stutzerimonas azotifigens TaxID=291995 RepID=UPI0004884BB4|nr:hypothetical protein [Stutzerimonas azotifigens]